MKRGDLGGCGNFLKYSLFIVNFLIFLLGLAILGLGIWVLTDSKGIAELLNKAGINGDLYVGSAAILLTFGGVVAFISFLGCCGAIKEVKCLLLTFFIILLLIFILIIVGAVFAYKIKNEVEDEINKGFLETMKEYDGNNDLKAAWNSIQEGLHCCGSNSYKDWLDKPSGIPESCDCKKDDSGCQKIDEIGDKYVWKEGCAGEILKQMKPLAIVGIVIAVIIFLAMIFSCALVLKL